MRLLASTDYALRVLMLLASAPDGERFTVDVLARELGGLSRNHLHKIVQELTGLGLTRTARGTGGGVALAVPPQTIRLGSLVRQLEADQPVVECFRDDGCTCPMLPACRLRGILKAARDRFYESLEAFTLTDCLTGAMPDWP